MAYLGVSPSNGVRKVHTYTATASQTTFSGAGAENISLSYRDSTYIDVYQNGVKLGDADYTATSGTSVVLGTGASADDIVVVVVYDVFSVADTVSKTDGGQFDGAVTFAGAFTSLGIDDNADATAITIDSDENIAIGVTSKNSANNGSLTIGHTGMTKVSASASGNADELILIGADASANVGMSIIANNANQSNIFFGDEDDTDIGGITYDHADNGLKFTTNTSERMRIDSSGNVGIGATSVTNGKLVLLGSNGTIGGVSGLARFAKNGSGGGAIESGDDNAQIQIGSDGTNGFISTGSNDIRLLTGGGERMRIDSSGNIGIGTTSPTKNLTIQGTASTLRLEDNTSGRYADIENSDGRMILRSDPDNVVASSRFVFEVDGSEVARIDDSQVLFHGITGRATGSTGHMSISDQSNNRSFLETATTSTTAMNLMVFLNPNGAVGTITTTSSATSFNTSSDYRLKENVSYDFDATTRLKQLKPARFNFIADADTTVDGFLAHEVQSIVPEAITGTHNEVEVWEEDEELPDGVSVGDNKLDDDGNTIPVYQNIDQSKLVPLLTKTLQEALTRIDTLEAEVKALKG